MLEIVRRLSGRFEHPPLKEIPVVEKYRASGLVLRIRESQDVIDSLIPSSIAGLSLPLISPGNLHLSESCWLNKGDPSPAKGQLQLPGGRRREKEANEKENPVLAFIRETGEEIDIFGIIKSNVRCITEWEHSFEHEYYPEEGSLIRAKKRKKTRIKYHDTVLVAEAPTTTDPQSYVTGDSIKEVVRLNLSQLRDLLHHNHIYLNGGQDRKVHLQDSLSSDPEIRDRQKTWTDGQEDEIKAKLTQAALAFEVKTLVKVLQRFFDITFSKDNWPQYLRKRFMEFLSDYNMDDLNAFYDLDIPQLDDLRTSLISLLQTTEKNFLPADEIDLRSADDMFLPVHSAVLDISGVDESKLRKRVKLIRMLRRAQNLVVIENNLISFEHAGPQTPFLFGQSFLLMDRHTPYEYQQLVRCKELQCLLGTLCAVFKVEVEQYPDWYEELRSRMKKYREQKTFYNMHPADNDTQKEVETISSQLISKFAQKLGISASLVSDSLTSGLNYSQRYIPQILASLPSLQSHLQTQLIPVREGESSIDFDELCLDAMGILRHETDEVTPESQWVALRTILLATINIKAKELAKKNKRVSALDPFLTFFNRLKERNVERIEGAREDDKVYRRQVLKLRSKLDYPWGITKLRFDYIAPQILTFFREKEDDSIMRKLIERGEIEGGNILDYYGRMIIIDTEDFWQNLVKSAPYLAYVYPADKAEIIKIWTIDIVKQIIAHYENQARLSGYTTQRLNPRLYGIFEDLLEHEYYAGSGASKITWDWAKHVFVFTLGLLTFREELQFFTSEGVTEKLQDDKRYSYERLFIAHEPGYYPPVTVYFLPQPEYGELVKHGRQSGTLFPHPQHINTGAIAFFH